MNRKLLGDANGVRLIQCAGQIGQFFFAPAEQAVALWQMAWSSHRPRRQGVLRSSKVPRKVHDDGFYERVVVGTHTGVTLDKKEPV